MEVLGPTIEAIATEKAQIIKRGDTSGSHGRGRAGLSVIRRRAARVDVPLVVTDRSRSSSMDRYGIARSLRRTAEMTVGLLGQHQAANAAVAWGILDALADAGIATVT